MERQNDDWNRLKNEMPAGGFERRVARRLEERCARRRRIWRWSAASAALAAAGVFLALAFERPRPLPSEPRATVAAAAEDVKIEDEIAEILYEPVLYSEALTDDVFREDDEDAGDGDRSYEVNADAFTYS